MLEHAWVYNYTEDDEIGGHCSRCGISDGTSPMPDCISEAEAKLRRLPADWEKDSSLETWFPLTAEELKRTNAENVWLKSWIKAAKQFAWAHETGCARGTSEGACTCGLDQFLGRSKMFVESYQAENAELRKDKERLDWYEAFGAIKYSTTIIDGKPRRYIEACYGSAMASWGDSLREAIDCARKPKSATEVAEQFGIAEPRRESQDESVVQETGL